MAIEIDVVPGFGSSHLPGILSGTVIVRFDGPIETMQINVLFAQQPDQAANEAKAIAMAKQLAFRFFHEAS
jgi:hypothetical protein